MRPLTTAGSAKMSLRQRFTWLKLHFCSIPLFPPQDPPPVIRGVPSRVHDRPRWKRLRAEPPNPFLEKNKSVTKIGELTHRLEGRTSTGVGKQTYER